MDAGSSGSIAHIHVYRIASFGWSPVLTMGFSRLAQQHAQGAVLRRNT